MLLPLLLNIALGSGKLQVNDDGTNYRLVVKTLGVNIVLSRIDKETIYQMTRTPGMPETHAEAVAQTATEEPQKALADDPVPLPRPARGKPQLTVIQGGQS